MLEAVEAVAHLDFAPGCDWSGGMMAPDTETCSAVAVWAAVGPCACPPLLRCDPHRAATDAACAAWLESVGCPPMVQCLECGVQHRGFDILWVPLGGGSHG